MLISEVISKYVKLHREGREWVGVCPFHGDHEPSLKVNDEKKIYKCFACGAGGTAQEFLKRIGAKEEQWITDAKSIKSAKSKPMDDWLPITPVPTYAEVPTFRHYKLGIPNKVWRYTDENSRTMFYVCRFNLKGGGKEILPFTYCHDKKSNTYKWVWKGLKRNRPLYNLSQIAISSKPICIVEGEKAADAGIKHGDKIDFTTWSGGANGFYLTDFTALKGKTVVLLPDNDDEGYKCMNELKPILEALKCNVWYFKNRMTDKPKKWDIADQEWNGTELDEFIRNRITSDSKRTKEQA